LQSVIEQRQLSYCSFTPVLNHASNTCGNSCARCPHLPVHCSTVLDQPSNHRSVTPINSRHKRAEIVFLLAMNTPYMTRHSLRISCPIPFIDTGTSTLLTLHTRLTSEAASFTYNDDRSDKFMRLITKQHGSTRYQISYHYSILWWAVLQQQLHAGQVTPTAGEVQGGVSILHAMSGS